MSPKWNTAHFCKKWDRDRVQYPANHKHWRPKSSNCLHYTWVDESASLRQIELSKDLTASVIVHTRNKRRLTTEHEKCILNWVATMWNNAWKIPAHAGAFLYIFFYPLHHDNWFMLRLGLGHYLAGPTVMLQAVYSQETAGRGKICRKGTIPDVKQNITDRQRWSNVMFMEQVIEKAFNQLNLSSNTRTENMCHPPITLQIEWVKYNEQGSTGVSRQTISRHFRSRFVTKQLLQHRNLRLSILWIHFNNSMVNFLFSPWDKNHTQRKTRPKNWRACYC